MDDDLLLLILGIVVALIIVTFIILGLKGIPENAFSDAIGNFISKLRFPKRQ